MKIKFLKLYERMMNDPFGVLIFAIILGFLIFFIISIIAEIVTKSKYLGW